MMVRKEIDSDCINMRVNSIAKKDAVFVRQKRGFGDVQFTLNMGRLMRVEEMGCC